MLRNDAQFAAALRATLRQAGRTQKELAREIGIHPHVLSHKLSGTDGARLTDRDRSAIAAALDSWGISAAATEGPQSTRLPAPATPLVGRSSERRALAALLRPTDPGHARLVTLTGAGGTGKTRLALTVAADLAPSFRDGVTFVTLAGIEDAALVPAQVAHALDVASTEGRPLSEAIASRICDRQMLLVLDNFEHVLSAAPLVSDLLAAAPELTILATSRARLNVYGEHEVRVSPLGSEGVELFAQRARAARPAIALDEEALAAAAAICERLDGLPLAIELAAARCRVFSPVALLARLGLAELSGGARDLPERQRTLAATLEWSYRLLDEPARQALTRAAVFAGTFGLEAAQRALGGEALALAEALRDAALLEMASSPGGEPRFRMLQTVREFGLSRLSAEDVRQLRADVAGWYVGWAERAVGGLTGHDGEQWAEMLELERENLNAALSWLLGEGEGDAALRLAAALGAHWVHQGHPADARPWLAGVLAATQPSLARARALLAAGRVCRMDGHLAEAADWLTEAATVYRRLGDAAGEAEAANELDIIRVDAGLSAHKSG